MATIGFAGRIIWPDASGTSKIKKLEFPDEAKQQLFDLFKGHLKNGREGFKCEFSIPQTTPITVGFSRIGQTAAHVMLGNEKDGKPQGGTKRGRS